MPHIPFFNHRVSLLSLPFPLWTTKKEEHISRLTNRETYEFEQRRLDVKTMTSHPFPSWNFSPALNRESYFFYSMTIDHQHTCDNAINYGSTLLIRGWHKRFCPSLSFTILYCPSLSFTNWSWALYILHIWCSNALVTYGKVRRVIVNP